MKKIGNFLFVEQCFTDTEETKPCVIHAAIPVNSEKL